ncbi:hypothetical protein C4D60_Mb11t22340 [Musa balbisiana]|uniref:Uncharacterized protein n=1 Tax=Musa balbisiana TaxID=52838 RepID=A0A4S8J683_MUSBA|nr:hypothetical protein C4D60_Mb11t22340 [Musa balbisiana]
MLVLDSPIAGPIAGENDSYLAEEIKHSNNFAVPGSKLGHQLAAVKRLLRPSHPRKRLPWRCASQAVLLHRRRHQKLENASVTSGTTRLDSTGLLSRDVRSTKANSRHAINCGGTQRRDFHVADIWRSAHVDHVDQAEAEEKTIHAGGHFPSF